MAEALLTAVAEAESLRRQRLRTRALLRVVPVVAGALLVTAALVRVLHLSLSTFWLVAGVAVIGVGIFAWLKGRVPAVTDAAAAQLDADAALGGELRSAHWFASSSESNAWTTFHLKAATERVERIAWPNVYPPVPTSRAWAGSAALALAAVALVLTSAWPRALGNATGAGSATPGSARANGGPKAVSDELQKQIDDLIKAVQSGAMPMDAARAKLSDMRNAVADLDPKLKDAMANAMKGQQPSDWNADDPDPKVNELAEKAQKAAGAALPQDMKWSLQDLAEKLQQANKSGQKADNQSAQSKEGAASPEKGGAGDQKAQEAGVQMTRNAGADSQSNQMMSSSNPMDGLMKVDPKGNDGGGPKNGAFKPLDLSALKKETIQADTDSQGSNVLADLRRKSEKARATIAFTRVAPLTTYDKSHAAAPPPPPDSLRSLVRQYFIRR